MNYPTGLNQLHLVSILTTSGCVLGANDISMNVRHPQDKIDQG